MNYTYLFDLAAFLGSFNVRLHLMYPDGTLAISSMPTQDCNLYRASGKCRQVWAYHAIAAISAGTPLYLFRVAPEQGVGNLFC
jgi:hypothetical protein